ncbi:MAG TPA: PQQ-binding-like beta-propeller repeat protein [Bryobacteraceae bacterium]|nr:PQQ-binding-like beta-propeller repeat protein [Bryobacteraceae bacterium]
MRAPALIPLLLPLACFAQQPAPKQPSGQELFRANCAACHGDDAKGSAQGPGLAMNPRVAEQTAEQLREFLNHGNPGAGMPSFADLPAPQKASLASYLRSINNDTIQHPAGASGGIVKWGPPQPGDWLTYNGSDSGNRYSPLRQITTANVASLKLKWIYPIDYFGLEATPLEADGVIYVTGPNQVFALNAVTGEAIWHYSRPMTPGLVGDPRLGTNRGVALLRDRIYFITDNGHLLGINRADGKLVWETPVAPEVKQPYGATVAPFVVGTKPGEERVIAGVTGADHGIRGFLAAFDPETGALDWRRWTVPRAGEPGIETWKGKEPVAGGGSTWLTGSYDAASDTLYWATGNPWPDSDDRDRPGDNLYTDCVLALNPKTGEIKWYYQFTPHDLKDRDATEPNVLVDTVYQGKPSKILLHADRNGFFYVLDRNAGKVLLAKTFLKRNDYASSIGPDGRPVVKDPRGCPSDAANWDSTAYSPVTRLYYFMALEECVGKPTSYPDQQGQRFLRAVNIDTGDVVWEIPQTGSTRAKTWSGVLATAGGLVFYGSPNGGFHAVDQKNGKILWEFPTNVRMKASPMTFSFKNKQYIVVAAGPNILCFGL